MPFITQFLHSQLFVTPLPPSHDFSGQTIIVTGSNTGLGLGAARHFRNLHCSKLIIAVRNISKGADAKKSLLSTSSSNVSPIQIEVWPLDLSSSDSVRTFARRASITLPRVDVLVSNAGVKAHKFALSEDGWESTLQTNVISTCLLAVLMLPKMRETGERFKTLPHLVVVTSDVHYVAKFAERNAKNGLMKALNGQEKFDEMERYSTTKLLQILFVRELSQRLRSSSEADPSSGASSPYTPVLTLPTPGLCYTTFYRDIRRPPKLKVSTLGTSLAYFGQTTALKFVGRTAEVGARTLVAAACAGKEADGQFMMDGLVKRPVGWIEGKEGKVVQKRGFEEIIDAFELRDDEKNWASGRRKQGARSN